MPNAPGVSSSHPYILLGFFVYGYIYVFSYYLRIMNLLVSPIYFWWDNSKFLSSEPQRKF